MFSSERTGDETVKEKYTLTIFDRKTQERVGQVKSHTSVVPFFISDSLFVNETQPYIWRNKNELVEEPAKIHGLDLKTGNEVWVRPVRDTSYRGPVPP
jgi:hypothetical protein